MIQVSAVAPDDERYAHLLGKTAILPLVGREIPIFADSYVEKEFGTGAVKMTPAHDPNDYEVGQRHNLDVIKVMTDDAHMADNAGKYAGMDRYEARKAIVKDLKEQGYLTKIEAYKHNVGTCYRCHNTIEPMISSQWFVKMEPLAKPAIDVVRNGETKFIPERFDKIYYHWVENIKGLVYFPSDLDGVTEYLHGTATIAARLSFQRKPLANVLSAIQRSCTRMRTHWTHGFHLLSGPSQHLVGRIKTVKI